MRISSWSSDVCSSDLFALADVIHLRPAYEHLQRRLEKTGRVDWLSEEMAVLTDPATYRIVPDEAWRRLKIRSTKPKFLAVLRELAAWREREAQSRDVPRNRVLRADALVDVAAQMPRSEEHTSELQSLMRIPHAVFCLQT